MSMATTSDVITAAMSIASDTADGKLSPTDLERQAVAEMHSLVGEVTGPDDPAWSLQVDIARQAVGLGALSADELREWAVVLDRQNGVEPVSGADPDKTPSELVSTASDELRAPEEPSGAVDTAEPEPPTLTVVPDPAPSPTTVTPVPSAGAENYDPLAAWRPGGRSTR